MSPATEDILRAALALTEEERTELIEELFAARPDSGDLPFAPAWLSEIQRRSAEIDEGRVILTPWAEVRDRVRESVRALNHLA
jgi:putative addiction module component (TIGR02574 family)